MFKLDIDTWNHITEYKLFVFDGIVDITELWPNRWLL